MDNNIKRLINPWVGQKGFNCFGCSPDNKFGLRLNFTEEGEDIVTQWDASADYQGWFNTLHGGIQATLLDEICGWVVSRKLRTAGLTSKMETRYKCPIETNGQRLTIRAHVTEQRRNIYVIEATIADAEGNICSEATCTYFTFSREKAIADMHFKDIEIEDDNNK